MGCAGWGLEGRAFLGGGGGAGGEERLSGIYKLFHIVYYRPYDY